MDSVINNVSLSELSLTMLAFLIVLSIWNLFLSLHLHRQYRRAQREAWAEKSRRKSAAADAPEAMLAGKLDRIQVQLEKLCEQQRLGFNNGRERSYELAQRLARQGATTEQLIEACGVSRQEAELISCVHGGSRAVPA